MARRAGLDALGILHHVMIRGIEKTRSHELGVWRSEIARQTGICISAIAKAIQTWKEPNISVNFQLRPQIRLTEIGGIKIPLPPLEVQKAIVAERLDPERRWLHESLSPPPKTTQSPSSGWSSGMPFRL